MKEEFLVYKLTNTNIRARKLSTKEIIILKVRVPLNIFELFTLK